MKFVLFGTGHFAEGVLKVLLSKGFVPSHIVTSPDKPVGRHQVMTASAVRVLAVAHDIPVSSPTTLKTEESLTEMKKIIDTVDVCVVVDYGKILPQQLLDLCPKGFLNIHPSKLPLHRGPAPLQATIFDGNPHTAVTIIKIDAQMDHGPIVVQKEVTIPSEMWPCPTDVLSAHMAHIAGELLIDVLPDYVDGKINLVEQDHEKATYTKMIDKKDAEISIDDIRNGAFADMYKKYCAYKPWPEIFFMHDGKRIKIKSMDKDGIHRVTPEGKTEISWDEYVRHHAL